MTALDYFLAYPRREQIRAVPLALSMGRADLPSIFRELGFINGAEIGVWKGAYSASFMQANPKLHMLCVDPWLSYPAWRDTKNDLPAEKQDRFIAEAYEQALKTLGALRCTIDKRFSVEAAADVPDRSLDFVYIDGNHVFDAVTEDLEAWAPKVRSGGVVAGHDFRLFTNKPTIHVVEAVRAYTTTHEIEPWFITARDRTPSFLWVVR